MHDITDSHRRWFQFSLKSLLVLMLVVAAYFAGIVTEKRRAEKALEAARQEAEATIQELRLGEQHARLHEDLARDLLKAVQQLDTPRRLEDARGKSDR